MNDSSNKDDGARLDWQSGGDSGMNAVLAWHHHYITQRQQWTAAALAARGVRVGARIQPGTGLLAIEGQEPGVVEDQRTIEGRVLPPRPLP